MVVYKLELLAVLESPVPVLSTLPLPAQWTSGVLINLIEAGPFRTSH